VAPQLAVLAVSAGDPEDARRRAQPVQESHEVHVFGYDQIDGFPSPLEDLDIRSVRKAQIEEMDRIYLQLLTQSQSKARRKLSVDPATDRIHLCRQDRMVEAPRGVLKAGADIRRFEVRVLGQDLLRALSCRQELENVRHPDAKPTNARPPTALFRIRGNPVEEADHGEQI